MYIIKKQTGPKGVIKDYQRFKQLEKERREDQKEELKQLTNKFAITCRTNVFKIKFLSSLKLIVLIFRKMKFDLANVHLPSLLEILEFLLLQSLCSFSTNLQQNMINSKVPSAASTIPLDLERL